LNSRSFTCRKLVKDTDRPVSIYLVHLSSMDGDDLCRECDGTGWVLFRSETEDGEFEEAYRLCPEGHAPRYCMGSSSGQLCYRPATVRCGTGYYCREHIVVIHEGRDFDDPCEAI
jgi:hypothetical protein